MKRIGRGLNATRALKVALLIRALIKVFETMMLQKIKKSYSLYFGATI